MSITIKQALALTEEMKAYTETWRFDGQVLLARALDRSREYLHTWPERELTAQQLQHFEELMERCRQGEPLAYILGQTEFWDFQVEVTPDVLVPRPETELLVEIALEIMEEGSVDRPLRSWNVADLGTGSGVIAFALTRTFDMCEVIGVDMSHKALALAKRNSNKLRAHRVEFRHGHWCRVISDDSMDMIVSNPPYVSERDPHLDRGGLQYEPRMALVSKENGYADIKEIIECGRFILRDQGWLLIEHGCEQAAGVREIFEKWEYSNITCYKDLWELDRVTFAQWLPKANAEKKKNG